MCALSYSLMLPGRCSRRLRELSDAVFPGTRISESWLQVRSAPSDGQRGGRPPAASPRVTAAEPTAPTWRWDGFVLGGLHRPISHPPVDRVSAADRHGGTEDGRPVSDVETTARSRRSDKQMKPASGTANKRQSRWQLTRRAVRTPDAIKLRWFPKNGGIAGH